jgi:hypothetical protein
VSGGFGIMDKRPMTTAMPSLTVDESAGRVTLQLGGFARGNGPSLQDAADDLIQSVLGLVMAFRCGGFSVSRELRVDVETMDYLHELGEVAAAGEDIRARVFG